MAIGCEASESKNQNHLYIELNLRKILFFSEKVKRSLKSLTRSSGIKY